MGRILRVILRVSFAVSFWILAANAETPAVLSERAQALAGEHRYEEAVVLWQQAIELDPGYYPALFNLGYCLFTQQKFTLAAPALARAVQAGPDRFDARYLLGAAYSKSGQVDEALRSWREALRLEPRNVKLMQIMAVEYGKGRYFAEASALARRVLELKADDPNVYFLAIKTAQDAGDSDGAAEMARRAAGAFPLSARANFENAFHLKLQGRITEALTYMQRAMKEDPAYEEPFFFYGNLLVDQGANAEAIPYLRKAIENRNDYVPARVVLARALMNEEKWNDAVAELRETISLDPKHPQPHLLLSQIYFRLGDESRAKEEKEISLRLRRENPTVLEAVQSRPFVR